jgi:hypothetical protein
MTIRQHSFFLLVTHGMAFALVAMLSCTSVRANVYATNIKVNGGVTNVIIQPGTPVNIGYLLNEPATLGITVRVQSGTNIIRQINLAGNAPGTARGTNGVVWDGLDASGYAPGVGTYSVCITAASQGFTNWTQTTDDLNSGNFVWEPRGIAVNSNTNSPYYGRVYVSNSQAGPGGDPGNNVGILKLNADGGGADEGIFTTGGYAWAGDLYSPWKIAVSADDYVYISDLTTVRGEVYRWDATLSTNSRLRVLATANSTALAALSGPFVTGTGTNAILWMADTDSPGSQGILTYALKNNGACAPNDLGTTVVGIGGGTNLSVAPFDMAVDQNGTIYAVQYLKHAGDPGSRVFRFSASTNQPPETNADWAVGGGTDQYNGAAGIAVDPTGRYVAVAFCGYGPLDSATNGSTKILNATNGVLAAELDFGLGPNQNHTDTDCAWDAVGNVYFADALDRVWRAFSPPGTNQATTFAPAKIQVLGPPSPVITGINVAGGIVTVTFTAASTDTVSSFALQSKALITAAFRNVDANLSQISPGVFRATISVNGPARFYRVRRI